jgi:WD40 repeat protein
VEYLLFSPDGGASCALAQCQPSLWDVATGQERHCEFPKWLDQSDFAYAVAFSPDGRTLAIGNYEDIGLWDVASGTNTNQFLSTRSRRHLGYSDRFLLWPDLPNSDPHIEAAAFRPNGDLMVLGSARNTVVMWRATTVPLKK